MLDPVDVDLRLLRYFVAVADTLHFGRAAEQLFVSQPALSQQIRRFEHALGFDLFIRDRRSVALTSAGDALVDEARAALAAGDAFGQAARRQRRAEHGELVVGFHVRWPYNVLPRVLRRYRDALPDISVQLVQHDFRDTSAGLRSGDADVALLHLPLVGDGLEFMPVAQEERVAMVARDDALADRETVTVAELVASGLAWGVPTDDDPVWRDFWSAAAERAAVGGADVEVVQPATQDALFQTIASGRAVALSYRALVEMYRPPGIALLRVAGLSPAVLAVAWRSDDRRRHVAAFVDHVVEILDARDECG